MLAGLGLAGVTAWGAWEAQAATGGVSYLTIAAPLVVFVAAFIPPVAERIWREQRLKAALLFACVIPVIALAWYSSKERVATTRAAQATQAKALGNAVTAAAGNVADAKARLTAVQAQADKAKGMKRCKAECIAKHDAEIAKAQHGVEAAQSRETEARAKAVTPAEGAPEWLLPFCGELLTFAMVWIGFAPRPVKRKPAKAALATSAPAEKPKAKRTPRQKMAASARRQASRVANDNVVMFPARA